MADNILIIGGGIGGLACALALIRRGIEVAVYEQASELREVGAGVQMGANGTRVLHALGLKHALEATQVVASGKQARLWNTGQTWTTFDLSAVSQERYGAPHIFMHRGDLHAALADAIRRERPDAIRLGCRFAALTQSDGGVTMTFENGEAVEGALAIGADGIRSPVRAALFGPDQTGIHRRRRLARAHPDGTPAARICGPAPPPTGSGRRGIFCIILCGAAR